MKKIATALLMATTLCALSACSTYTEATTSSGAKVKRVAIAPGTSITTPKGCINSAGGTCDPQAAASAADGTQ